MGLNIHLLHKTLESNSLILNNSEVNWLQQETVDINLRLNEKRMEMFYCALFDYMKPKNWVAGHEDLPSAAWWQDCQHPEEVLLLPCWRLQGPQLEGTAIYITNGRGKKNDNSYQDQNILCLLWKPNPSPTHVCERLQQILQDKTHRVFLFVHQHASSSEGGTNARTWPPCSRQLPTSFSQPAPKTQPWRNRVEKFKDKCCDIRTGASQFGLLHSEHFGTSFKKKASKNFSTFFTTSNT